VTLSDREEAEAAADLFDQLDQLATVYGGQSVSGRYTVVIKTKLECRLQPVNQQEPGGGTRAELMAVRDFYWNPEYELPERSQILIDGIRWQPEAGTFQALRAGRSGVLIRRCSVVRIQTSSF
jgi:hypothetical protein